MSVQTVLSIHDCNVILQPHQMNLQEFYFDNILLHLQVSWHIYDVLQKPRLLFSCTLYVLLWFWTWFGTVISVISLEVDLVFKIFVESEGGRAPFCFIKSHSSWVCVPSSSVSPTAPLHSWATLLSVKVFLCPPRILSGNTRAHCQAVNEWLIFGGNFFCDRTSNFIGYVLSCYAFIYCHLL